MNERRRQRKRKGKKRDWTKKKWKTKTKSLKEGLIGQREKDRMNSLAKETSN
jgi:hypothetical protein